jgi:chromosome segregation ATPase
MIKAPHSRREKKLLRHIEELNSRFTQKESEMILQKEELDQKLKASQSFTSKLERDLEKAEVHMEKAVQECRKLATELMESKQRITGLQLALVEVARVNGAEFHRSIQGEHVYTYGSVNDLKNQNHTIFT